MKKQSLLMLSLLIFSVCIVSTRIGVVKGELKTIVVPDDYSTIQDAIDNANEGDTVFVENGIYLVDDNTSIVISKTLSLIGEDPANTVILGAFSMYPENDVAIRLAAPNITISGFTITNCRVAIAIVNYYDEPYPSGCKIINNNITNNSEGIRPQRNDLLISGNNITKNQNGIAGYNTENIIIAGNKICENNYGINIGICRNITVRENQILSNIGGLNLYYYGPHIVHGNIIKNNEWGIRFAEACSNAHVYENDISENDVGVVLLNFPNGGDVVVSGRGNTVFNNLFIDNTEHVGQDERNFPIPDSWSMGTDIIAWDNGTSGNYWSNYNSTDNDGDGIADSPYVIDENNQDNFPLMEPTMVPEFPSWAILPLFLITTVSVIVVRKKLVKSS